MTETAETKVTAPESRMPRLIHRYVFNGVKLTANGRTFKKGQSAYAEPGGPDDRWLCNMKCFAGPDLVMPGKDADKELRTQAERAAGRTKAEMERLARTADDAKEATRKVKAESAAREAHLEAEIARLRAEVEAEQERAVKAALKDGTT